ncbi:hypothetical protein [Salibacterium aidingense]|uniref:hypothetical protein n=1 Tax=Salibacterium aidingense TaxID=384933 RepID=UPI000410B4E4|nr:hypothetical protein [Salibacterium aidingense]
MDEAGAKGEKQRLAPSIGEQYVTDVPVGFQWHTPDYNMELPYSGGILEQSSLLCSIN